MYAIPLFTIPPIDLGPIGLGQLHFFTITTVCSVLVTLLVFEYLVRRGREFDPLLARWFIIAVIAGGYLGGYWGQLFLYHPEWLDRGRLIWLQIWRGGFSSIGGFYGAAIIGWLFCRIKRMPLLPYLERAWVALAIAWVVARLGCAVIHDHPGLTTDFFLGVRWPDGVVRHDLGLYELLLQALVIVPALLAMTHRPWRLGSLMGMIFVVYSPFRFWWDFLRINEPKLWGFTPAQFGLIGIFTFGLGLLIQGRRKEWSYQAPLW